MTIVQYLHVLRRQWLVVLLLAAVGVGAAYAYTDRQVRTYSATTQMFVGITGEARGSGVSQMSEGSSFVQQRIKSYADVVTSPAVLNSVSAAYGVPVEAGQISVTAPADTVLLEIAVTDTDRSAPPPSPTGSPTSSPTMWPSWKSFRSRSPRRSGSR